MVFRDITLGQYFAADSSMHHLDPRTKLLLALGLMVAGVVSQALGFYLVLAFFLLFGVSLARLPIKLALRNLKAFRWLFLITFLAHLLFTEGRTFFSLPGVGWTLTVEGAYRGTVLALRLAVMVLITNLLTLTTAPLELSDGIERLLMPLQRIGLPAHEVAMMTIIALRFIPTLIAEADRLMKAQMARGADFSGGLIRRTQRLLPLLVPLMVSAFRRAEELAVAMEARCYRGAEGRSHLVELHLKSSDYWAVLVCAGTVATAWLGGRI